MTAEGIHFEVQQNIQSLTFRQTHNCTVSEYCLGKGLCQSQDVLPAGWEIMWRGSYLKRLKYSLVFMELLTSTSISPVIFQKHPDYLVIADYSPSRVNGEAAAESVKLTEGQFVEVLDMERADRWLVQTRPTKTCTAKQGWVPSAYLEAKTAGVPLQRRSTREVFREDVLQISNKQQEATLKRR